MFMLTPCAFSLPLTLFASLSVLSPIRFRLLDKKAMFSVFDTNLNSLSFDRKLFWWT